MTETTPDTVPRSRLVAMEAELDAADAKLAKVQKDAGAEIDRLNLALHRIRGHLGVVVMQIAPADDQIIMNHIRSANEIAKQVRLGK